MKTDKFKYAVIILAAYVAFTMISSRIAKYGLYSVVRAHTGGYGGIPDHYWTSRYILGIEVSAFRVWFVIPILLFSLYAYWKVLRYYNKFHVMIIVWGLLFLALPLFSPIIFLLYSSSRTSKRQNVGYGLSKPAPMSNMLANGALAVFVIVIIVYFFAIFTWSGPR